MHRQEYVGVEHASREHQRALHRRYYGQFVDDRVRAVVQRAFGLAPLLPHDLDARLRERGDCLSPMSAVCILKEAATQLVRHGVTS